MANDESILREVDQELAEERQWAFFTRNGPVVIGVAAAVVLVVAGVQIWNAQKSSAAARSAAAYQAALTALEEDPAAGRAALQAFSEGAPKGYAILAEMRRAGALAANGERTQALAIYREIYEGRGAPKRLAQLARLRAALLALEDGRDAVMADLGELEADPSALGFHAREIAGVAALEAGDYATAINIFDAMIASLETPRALRARAEEFAALAEAGKAGANLTRDLQADDLAETLGALGAKDASSDATPSDEAAGPEEEADAEASSGDGDDGGVGPDGAAAETTGAAPGAPSGEVAADLPEDSNAPAEEAAPAGEEGAPTPDAESDGAAQSSAAAGGEEVPASAASDEDTAETDEMTTQADENMAGADDNAKPKE